MTETPSFYLSHGLNDVGKVNRVNPRLYTERTWFDHVSDRFAAFTADEAGAILGYLSWIAHHRGDLDGTIAEAVGTSGCRSHWRGKLRRVSHQGWIRRSRLDSVKWVAQIYRCQLTWRCLINMTPPEMC